MKEGWLCPRCKKVNAPFTFQCTCKSDIIKEWLNIPESNDISECLKGNHQWECCGISTEGTTYRCRGCGEIKTENYNVDKSNITISSQ